jgi:arsenate reductase (thioredoxin)
LSKPKVLFMCVHNSARSQMAEALLRELALDRFEVFSAGFEPTQVDPLAIEVMDERGIDISAARAKGTDDLLGKVHFGYVITVCERAQQQCPKTFPGMGTRLHWPFDDLAAVEGDHDDRLAAYREIRDQIETRIREWLATLDVRHTNVGASAP